MYLELTDISKKIGADEVLSGITLSMERGKVYGSQGKNGCGKSMLMRVICGLVLPTTGEVFSWNETETRDCSCNHGKTRTDYLR